MTSPATEHLQALGQAMGIASLGLDPQGLRSLAVGDDLVINIQHDAQEGDLVLFAALGSLPPEPSAPALLRLLRANRFWRGAGGATLSLDDNDPPRLILARRVSLSAQTPARFVEIFESFVDHAHDWSGAVAADAQQGAGLPSKPFMGQLA